MALHTRSKIPITLEPAHGWTFTGEYQTYGGKPHPVYRRMKSWSVRSVQVMTDRTEKMADGRDRVIKSRKVLIPQAFYAEPDPRAGQPVPEDVHGVLMNDDNAPITFNPDAFEDFIQIDTGAGMDQILTNFREDPEIVARRAREEARKRKWEKIMDEFDPEDIATAIALAEPGKRQTARRGA